jgi:hypothetical protein
MQEPSNILLIVLDAVRSDVLGPPSSDTERTHEAQRCITSAPWTLPSCMAMLRGNPAWNIGPRAYWRPHRPQGVIGRLRGKTGPDPTPPNPLLDRLGDEWRKVAYVNNPAIGPGSGVDTGFDVWEYLADYEEPFERAATAINTARRGEPLLLLLHSNMVHDFYRPAASRYARTVGAPIGGPRIIQWRDLGAEEEEAARATYRACADTLESRIRATIDLARQRDDFTIAVTADHGEGLEPDRARVHHAGRVHQDLIQVPLWFDLPSSTSAPQRDLLAERLASSVFPSTAILPTLFETAGVTDLGTHLEESATPTQSRTVVSEDRKYLYLRDRFRLNWMGIMQHMTKSDQRRNTRLLQQLDQAIVLRSFLQFPEKLVVTCFTPKVSASRRSLPSALRELFQHLPGSPLLLSHGDQVLALQHYDLVDDPAEESNLLTGNGWQAELLEKPWINDLTILGSRGAERSLVEVIQHGKELAL